MWLTHAPTFNKCHKKKKKKKTLHMLTQGAMRGCGLTSWTAFINDKFCDIREKNVTIKSEIWTTKIRTLGFRDIRECVTLWGLILWSLGCDLNAMPSKCNALLFGFLGWSTDCNSYSRLVKVWQARLIVTAVWVRYLLSFSILFPCGVGGSLWVYPPPQWDFSSGVGPCWVSHPSLLCM